MVIFLLLSISAWAIDRTPYVHEASKELGIYLQFAASDPHFEKKLNAEETKQFSGILKVMTSYEAGIPVQFSERQEDFILNPGEPPRSAKTTQRIQDPIWINTVKLNSDEQISYLSILQLFIHELGHKLGREKNQIAVDTLATKFREFLSSYYRNEQTFWRVSEGNRPMRERLELLSIPKRASGNPNPALFYIDDRKAWKINLHFEESLKLDSQKFVRVDRTIGEQINGGIYTKVSLSVYKEFTRRSGEKIYALEDSFEIAEQIPVGIDRPGEPYDKNFRLARLKNRYPLASADSFVEQVEELSRSNKEVQWRVRYQSPLRGRLALVAGTQDRYFLIPCISENTSSNQTAICTFRLPAGTAISILDVFQFLVDGQAIDLPEIVKLDLEYDFKLKFDLSDLEPLKLDKKPPTTYLLKMKSKYAPIQVRVRCHNPRDFYFEGELLGKIDFFSEEVFFHDELPIEKSGLEFTVTASCKNHYPSEILVTDALLYTSRPNLRSR